MNRRLLKGFIITILCVFLSVAVYAKTEVYFSHVDDIQAIILLKINSAEDSIDIAMYTFTDFALARALAKAKERGVKVRIYLDRSQVKAKYGQSRYLAQNELDVRISSNSAIMHNKFAIIDGEILITGSYNWTISANKRNDENVLVIDCRYVIDEFQEQFNRLWLLFSPTLMEVLIERSE